MLTNPRYQITEIGVTELIGADEQVDQNDLGGSVAVTLGDGIRPVSGEILSFMFYTHKTGTGAILQPTGTLLLLDADPAVTAGDTAVTSAENLTILGTVTLEAGDWTADANGARASIIDTPIPFHNLHTLYAVWLHTLATSFNDGGGDDEIMSFNAWYRRDT